MELRTISKKGEPHYIITMETTNLKRRSSSSFDESSFDIHTDSTSVSVHIQFPFLTIPFPNFATVLPVSTEIIDRKSLSHPFGTCNHIFQCSVKIPEIWKTESSMSVKGSTRNKPEGLENWRIWNQPFLLMMWRTWFASVTWTFLFLRLSTPC